MTQPANFNGARPVTESYGKAQEVVTNTELLDSARA